MEVLNGKSVFSGIAIGKVSIYNKGDGQVKREKVTDTAAEIQRFEAAKEKAKEQLGELYEKALREVGEVNAMIFEVHQMMLDDLDYVEAITHMIENQSINAEYAVATTGDNFSDLYERIEAFLRDEILPLECEPSVENILVVCHGAVIRAFLTYIKQMSVDDFWTIHQPNCSVNRILVRDGQFTVEKENILYYDDPELTHRGIL